jgi:lysozyme
VTYRDPSFYQNWGAANSFHLRAGVYHFFHPADDPVEQAQWFLGSLPYPLRLKVATLIPVVDIEETGPPGKDEWPRFTPAEGQAALEKFCQAVDAALGVRPMLYCRTEWMEANWPGYVWDGLYWLAQYPPAIPLPGVYPWIPTGWPKNNCKLWQYSSTGSVSGIKGAVDLNRFLGQDLKEITL